MMAYIYLSLICIFKPGEISAIQQMLGRRNYVRASHTENTKHDLVVSVAYLPQ
jgi:hypothetical protein